MDETETSAITPAMQNFIFWLVDEIPGIEPFAGMVTTFVQEHPLTVVRVLEDCGMLTLGSGAVIDNDN